jgi:trehalose synthase
VLNAPGAAGDHVDRASPDRRQWSTVEQVNVSVRDPARLSSIIGAERSEQFLGRDAADAFERLHGRSVININSTAAGGGVAEMLHVLLGYIRGLHIDARWLTIDGSAAFFEVTKRLHNHLYGAVGDGGALLDEAHDIYRRTLRDEFDALAAYARAGDIVVLHDPQTAGLAEHASGLGCKVVWRCHVGVDVQNDRSRAGWQFLRPYLDGYVDHYVFSDGRFPPDWVPRDRLSIIWPSIDPFAPKNQPLDDATVEAILTHVGLIAGTPGDTVFERADGSPGRVERMCDIVRTGPPPPPATPIVVQVSRWDAIKDMGGVMEAFANHVDSGRNAELVLAGPVVSAVADDPEGGQVLQQCWNQWRQLPHAVRSRVQLVCLPMHDLDENAVIVNALQRHATIVVQKSLAEGFGLTAAEAMLKGTPVVASAVGGLVDQVIDGESGLLVKNPLDLGEFGAAVCRILDDDDLRRRLGEGARQRAIDTHLGDTHLRLWGDVIRRLADQ